MLRRLVFLALTFFSFGAQAQAQAQVRPLSADSAQIQEDLSRILAAANLKSDRIEFIRTPAARPRNEAVLVCSSPSRLTVQVSASDAEWSSTLYYALQRMGFLFPHPRMQISPSEERLRALCGARFTWSPRLNYRGFHLHTQHPNEWMHGFLMGESKMANDLVRWLARNQQNVFSVVLLKTAREENLLEPFALARKFGILSGIDVSFSSQQQKAYRLVNRGMIDRILDYLSSAREDREIETQMAALVKAVPADFLIIELGSSEFTSTGAKKTLGWIETAAREAEALKVGLFFKIHVSVNQVDKTYGNFNFLPRFGRSSVGILPHTVMDYALEDASAPVYGRKDFSDLRELILAERGKRPVWYYPETSYFIAMDIDVPLFLTDYLTARSRDMDYLEDHGIDGQIDFTSGQELGYWLMDWTVALLANREHHGDPLVGLKLLGENVRVWTKIIDYEHEFIQKAGLLGVLSSSTLLDELPFIGMSVHERTLIRDLRERPEELKKEVGALEQAVRNIPPVDAVKNSELRDLLTVTFNRVRHALYLRQALMGDTKALELAKAVRLDSLRLMNEVVQRFDRYPQAHVFTPHENLTSYPYGYGWTAATLHYWEREERMVAEDRSSPWFMNIYDPFRILF